MKSLQLLKWMFAFMPAVAIGQTVDHVEIRITPEAVIVDEHRRLVDDVALENELSQLAQMNPRPQIHISLDPGTPFERVVHFLQIASAHSEFRLGLVTRGPSP